MRIRNFGSATKTRPTMKRRHYRFPSRLLSLSIVMLIVIPSVASGTTFFNDLTAEVGGADPVTSTLWIAGSFKTDAAAYNSLTASVRLAQTSIGLAQLDLYSDGGLHPNALMATFTSPVNYAT